MQGWQRKLNEYFLDVQRRYVDTGLAYGEFDCCIYVADWVRILTGEDVMAEYRGVYSSEAEVDAILQQETSLYHALLKRFGEPVHPAKAQRGDIGYYSKERALGIFYTSGASMKALLLGKGGLAPVPARFCDHAFRVR